MLKSGSTNRSLFQFLTYLSLWKSRWVEVVFGVEWMNMACRSPDRDSPWAATDVLRDSHAGGRGEPPPTARTRSRPATRTPTSRTGHVPSSDGRGRTGHPRRRCRQASPQ